jgi:hypothetical protein
LSRLDELDGTTVDELDDAAVEKLEELDELLWHLEGMLNSYGTEPKLLAM